ncbi:MAG: DUF6090 family protein [Melioribacteraceae bacterium]|nr:DUF6090 family protein [Melioribacteraceae bacterium]
MLTFFRRIRLRILSLASSDTVRKGLLGSGQTQRYILYAIGEIALVVIGILIALQINNWNERRKEHQIEKELYHNLTASLKTDSIAVVNIDSLTQYSLALQELILTTPSKEILNRYNNEELRDIVRGIWRGVYSFYPQMGIYNQILSSNLMKLIQSEEIKEGLRKYYDFTCTRISVIDPIINERYHIYFQNYISKEVGMVVLGPLHDKMPPPTYTIEKLEHLKVEIASLYDLTYAASNILTELEKDINVLLVLIKKQIN